MEGTEDGITLAIKPNGITCTLSKFLPQYIAKNIAFFADGFLKKNNLSRDDGENQQVVMKQEHLFCRPRVFLWLRSSVLPRALLLHLLSVGYCRLLAMHRGRQRELDTSG